MSRADLLAILPLLIAAGTSLVALTAIAVRRSHRATFLITLAGLAAAVGSLAVAGKEAPRQVSPLLVLDSYSLFYTGLILAAAAVLVLFSYGYMQGQKERREEFYPLLCLAALGAAVMSAASHFVSFFLGLELLSVSLFALIAFQHTELTAIEAAVKYLLMAGVSSAFLIFGLALIYAEYGTLGLAALGGELASGAASGLIGYAGLGMILVGLGFKLAVVPFHMWAPDVFQGATAPVAALIATVSKAGVFVPLMRFVQPLDAHGRSGLLLAFTLIAVASMGFGNLLALLQANLKRLLAYSSIAHFGYLLVAFIAGGPGGATAAGFYFVTYFATTLAAFGVLIVLSGGGLEADLIADYRGLAWRSPWLAGALTVALLSLAGIPISAGFFAKLFVLGAGVEARRSLASIALVIASAIGLYYYLRILVTVFRRPGAEEPAEAAGRPPAQGGSLPGAGRPPAQAGRSIAGGAALAVLTLILLALGVFPGPLFEAIRRWIGGLF
jgi:NADH-quinone oxidoreductase subunit N